MKRVSFILLLLTIIIGCSNQENNLDNKAYVKSENDLIDFLINEAIQNHDTIISDSSKTLVLLNDTLFSEVRGRNMMTSLAPDSIFEGHFKFLDKELQANLKRLGNNGFSNRVSMSRKTIINSSYTLISWDGKTNYKGFKDVRKIKFSRVAFNKDFSKAFVYYQFENSYDWSKLIDAGGNLMLLEKKNGKWKIIYERSMWAAC